MKRLAPITLLPVLIVSVSAFADDMGGMKMNKHTMGMEAMQPAHKANGTVKAIDAAKGTITISHGAVSSAQWPAMTMTFKIAPDMIGEIKEGQRVDFEFVTQGKDATVTKISSVK